MELNEQQKDALRELGNIGASHAATSLSQMLMSPVDMTVPEVRIVDISRINEHFGDEIAALVVFEIQGELSPGGYIVMHISKDSAIRMTNTMLGQTDMDRELTEMDQSALVEVGNIMVSQFLDATATLLDIVMIPSPPAIAIDMAHAAFQSIIACIAKDINSIILFRTELSCEEYDIDGALLLMPDTRTLNEILDILNRMIYGT
jgi:chemotaxis protein CheC